MEERKEGGKAGKERGWEGSQGSPTFLFEAKASGWAVASI